MTEYSDLSDHKETRSLRDKLKKLFALLGSDNQGECKAARQKIVDIFCSLGRRSNRGPISKTKSAATAL